MLILTADSLSKIATLIKGDRADKITKLINSVCPIYGIDTPDIFHEFISNVLHESAEFTRLEEGLNYQAIALTKVFGRHRISIDDCYRYGRTMKQKANTRAIANLIYGGSWGRTNLGNTLIGDGWDFRGSGPIQNTGRSNITKFTNYYNTKFGGKHTPEAMAILLRTDLNIGIHSACWFFAIAKNLIQLSIDDKMTEVVKRINGGVIGMKERLHYLKLAEKYIV